MIEIRFHGRGGQGAVIACNIVAKTAMNEGKFVQSFPLFGAERRGAAVQAFLRVDTRYIYARDVVETPLYVVVLDEKLIKTNTVRADKGLQSGGGILINSKDEPGRFDFPPQFSVATVDASNIALKNGLGTLQAPIVNTAMLGAFVRFTNLVNLDNLFQAIAAEIADRREANIAAAKEAYGSMKVRAAKIVKGAFNQNKKL